MKLNISTKYKGRFIHRMSRKELMGVIAELHKELVRGNYRNQTTHLVPDPEGPSDSEVPDRLRPRE